MRFALALLLVVACSKSEPPASDPPTTSSPTTAPARTTKDPAKAKELVASGATVIDVRTSEEFAEDHLAQATNIPVQELSSRIAEIEKLTGGDKSKPVVLYCASGGRAGRAAKQLVELGYTNVVNGGGLDDLK